MQKHIRITATLFSAFLINATYALEFGKPIQTPILINQSNSILTMTPARKYVTLMNPLLTSQEKNLILNYDVEYTKPSATNFNFPSRVLLGMNNVPVLDQGNHGTCTTFANTAALDAALGKGEYISELCNLELGNYLESEGYFPSGWDGSDGEYVLDQMLRFGIVNKITQRTKGCANVTEYPLKNADDKSNIMSADEFKTKSENINHKISVIYHLNYTERFNSQYNDKLLGDEILRRVKSSLTNRHRLTFATILLIIDSTNCYAGACASYRVPHDTWALTRDLDHNFTVGAHEMIITGFDDNAFAMDQYGKRHRGLLYLRNSWGDDSGDHGNYYMTYDYFKKAAYEVQEIINEK